MRNSVHLGGLALAAAATFAAIGAAYAQFSPGPDCDRLWYERNSIYKAAGYCFQSVRAIRTFGNAGCRYDSEAALSFTRAQEERIRQLIYQEQLEHCGG